MSESFARREWPSGGAIGRYLAVSFAAYRSVQVVGIGADVRTVPDGPPDPAIYLPYAQMPMSEVTVLVRSTAGDPMARCGAAPRDAEGLWSGHQRVQYAAHGYDRFAMVGAAVLVVTLLASYLPARRATRVDPIVALRAE